MLRFLLLRSAHGALVMLASVVLTFAVLRSVPGDGLASLQEQTAGDADARAAARLAERRRRGLDRPWTTQFAQYSAGMLHGELGTSDVEHRPVGDVLRPALAASLQLCGAGLLLALAIGGAVGIVQGWLPATIASNAAGRILVLLYAIPEFVLAVAIVTVLAFRLSLFPLGGMSDPLMDVTGTVVERVRDRLWHLALPALTLGLGWSAVFARQQRAQLLDIRGADCLRTAVAKGLSGTQVLRAHAIPMSLPGMVAAIGAMLPAVVGGAVVVETLFAWPGMGTLMLRAISARDLPVLSAGILVTALTVTLIALAVDVSAAALDPRQRSGVRD